MYQRIIRRCRAEQGWLSIDLPSLKAVNPYSSETTMLMACYGSKEAPPISNPGLHYLWLYHLYCNIHYALTSEFYSYFVITLLVNVLSEIYDLNGILISSFMLYQL